MRLVIFDWPMRHVATTFARAAGVRRIDNTSSSKSNERCSERIRLIKSASSKYCCRWTKLHCYTLCPNRFEILFLSIFIGIGKTNFDWFVHWSKAMFEADAKYVFIVQWQCLYRYSYGLTENLIVYEWWIQICRKIKDEIKFKFQSIRCISDHIRNHSRPSLAQWFTIKNIRIFQRHNISILNTTQIRSYACN